VEKVVDGEMKQRETLLTEQMNEASRKIKAGDNDGAIKLYKAYSITNACSRKKQKMLQRIEKARRRSRCPTAAPISSHARAR